MPIKSRKMATIVIVMASLAIVWGVKTFLMSPGGKLSTAANAKIKGKNDAPLKITEFIDFECPACAVGSKYLARMIEDHPDLIRLQLKYYPLPMHPHGYVSAQYAECAAQQDKFWPMHDLLIERQGNWKQLSDAKPAFNRMTVEIGMDRDQLIACLASEDPIRVIERDKLEGQSKKLRSTPTYFLNGKMIVGMQSLQSEINNHLRRE